MTDASTPSKDVALSLRELADKLPKQPVHLGLLQQALRGGAADIEQLRERVKDLQQFHDWAEPQVHDHGRDVLEIERLRVALRAALHPHSRECAYSKEWKRGVAPQCDCGIGALLLGEPSRDETSCISQAATDVLAERQRQVTAEGWTPEHDDEHSNGELAKAAACYALSGSGADVSSTWSQWWPWHPRWWKTAPDIRRQLVKAGALIIAEIERRDRNNVAVQCSECQFAGVVGKWRSDCPVCHGEIIPAVEPIEQRICLGCGEPCPCPSDCPAGSAVETSHERATFIELLNLAEHFLAERQPESDERALRKRIADALTQAPAVKTSDDELALMRAKLERLQRWAAKAGHFPECAHWKPWTQKGCTCGLVDLMLSLPEEPTAEWDPSTIAEKPHPVGCQCGWCAITKRASEEVGLPLLMPKEPAAAPDLCPKCGQEMFWHGYIYYGHRWDDGPRTPDEIICPKPTPQNRSANEAGPLPESLQRLAGWESAPAHESDSSVFVNAAAGNFALTPEATETEMPTPDWTKPGEHVCINHNGYTGPSADCPSCTAEKH